jgi:hypothetical protein
MPRLGAFQNISHQLRKRFRPEYQISKHSGFLLTSKSFGNLWAICGTVWGKLLLVSFACLRQWVIFSDMHFQRLRWFSGSSWNDVIAQVQMFSKQSMRKLLVGCLLCLANAWDPKRSGLPIDVKPGFPLSFCKRPTWSRTIALLRARGKMKCPRVTNTS